MTGQALRPQYEHTVAKATAAGVGSAEWKTAPRYARLGNPTCHPTVTELHADVSSAAAEIYAASVMLSRTMYLSYVSDELGIPFETPIKIQVDNQTALSFATGTVKKSKLRHIDARQDWVQALRDANLVKLAKVHTRDNLADLGTKLEPGAGHLRGTARPDHGQPTDPPVQAGAAQRY